MDKKNYRSWLITLGISLLIFTLTRDVFAGLLEEESGIEEYLLTSDVQVGSESGEDGFQQIYYVYRGNKVFITSTNYANGEPETDGEYIVWMGQAGANWRIFLYHIPTSTTTELSGGSNNTNPKISEDKVVWEGWHDGAWQIFLFDKTSVKKLTNGNGAVNASIEGDYVVYSERSEAEQWTAVGYSISQDDYVDVTVGEEAKNVKIGDGQVVLVQGNGTSEVFPLTLDDLFLLELNPLGLEQDAPKAVSVDEIIDELSR